ncbi:MAG: FtsX-like permease family protein, partial [Micromonosporaceae bacterium]
GSATLPVLGAGVFGVFIGVALLSPLLTRPVAGLVGGLLSWGAASRLGRRNALRDPRRTAVTAAALMIGVTLVSAVSTLGASFKATTEDLFNDQRGADVMISTYTQGAPSGQTGFDPDKLQDVREIDGVSKAVAVRAAAGPIDGRQGFLGALDVSDARDVLALETKRGEVRDLDHDEALVTDRIAKDRGWKVGDEVPVQPPKGPERSYTIVGTYHSPLMSGMLLPESAAKNFDGPLAFYGAVKLAPGADSARVANQVEKIMADYPLVAVADRSQIVDQVNSQIDIALNIFTVLLVLAVVIAFLGIVNTLLLSIYERTRELGMLRAIGMARKQVKRMIRVESVIMAVFGCVLGIGLGLALGAAVTTALINQEQMTAFALPGADLAGFVAVAVVAGVVAAWWPAFRASRLNVLEAIAYE